MTTLYILGSGSSGNAFAIACGGEVLLVDAGFSAREISRRAGLVGLDLARAVGVVLTHEHGDHARGATQLAQRLRIPVLTAPGTWDRLRSRAGRAEFLPLALLGGVICGGFHIECCAISHDAAEPVALSVRSAAGHRVGVAYDLGRPTMAVRYMLRESHALILEANHDEILLRTSGYPPVVQQRIAGSGGHLSNRAAAELLGEVAHEGLEAVILAHLSERCNTPEEATAVIAPVLQQTGWRTVLHIARQDLPLPPIGLVGLTSAATPGAAEGR